MAFNPQRKERSGIIGKFNFKIFLRLRKSEKKHEKKGPGPFLIFLIEKMDY
jgi:hypothetical protein